MQQDPWTASSADDGLERRFGGVTRLLGAHAHARLRAARIGVVGVGGVGSWAAEALARSGVERITLIDLDHVAESNANRQIQALDHEFGKAKVALIVHARAIGLRVVTCGAAGGRTDPTRIRCADLAQALGDPLLAKVRYRLRRRHGFARETTKRRPPFGVDAIYSDEPVRRPQPPAEGSGSMVRSGLACAGFGSSVVVTAPFGFAAAARAVDRIIGA